VIADATRDEVEFKSLPAGFKPPHLKLGAHRREARFGAKKSTATIAAADRDLLDTSLRCRVC